jgi:hypothetical protein
MNRIKSYDSDIAILKQFSSESHLQSINVGSKLNVIEEQVHEVREECLISLSPTLSLSRLMLTVAKSMGALDLKLNVSFW